MKNLLVSKESYFMDDPREGERLERKANAQQFVDKYLREHLNNISHGVILEAGCGSGALMNTLARNYLNHSVIGVDVSEDRINQGQCKSIRLEKFKSGYCKHLSFAISR
jgi:2-polyprenyl-3-methyl-5-hydroxy-6-metoxy-1,4-benzoquinol methylase